MVVMLTAGRLMNRSNGWILCLTKRDLHLVDEIGIDWTPRRLHQELFDVETAACN